MSPKRCHNRLTDADPLVEPGKYRRRESGLYLPDSMGISQRYLPGYPCCCEEEADCGLNNCTTAFCDDTLRVVVPSGFANEDCSDCDTDIPDTYLLTEYLLPGLCVDTSTSRWWNYFGSNVCGFTFWIRAHVECPCNFTVWITFEGTSPTRSWQWVYTVAWTEADKSSWTLSFSYHLISADWTNNSLGNPCDPDTYPATLTMDVL